MSRTANFDRIARPYRALEYLTLGKKLEQTRFHFLPQLANARNALVLGDGDGRFLARLLAENRTMEATAVDGSATMLALLRRRCSAFTHRLKTVQTDALVLKPEPDVSYDLIVSHFFLDCFTAEELDRLLQNLLPALQDGTQWLISDFQIPQSKMHLPALVLVRTLYLAFRVVTGLRVTQLPDYAACLLRAGFECRDRKTFFSGILSTELWELRIADRT